MRIIILLTIINAFSVSAQTDVSSFPELIMTEIGGAPKLTMPVSIVGTKLSVTAQGMGLASPAFYDWDGDGLKDLLIGEFGSGVEYGRAMGNFVRVYKNSGSDSQPQFTGTFDYARPPFKLPGNGTPYSVSQYCCIGFTPQFLDLNSDGQIDMISGTYYGEVVWFPGTNEGFAPGLVLDQNNPQEGDPRNGLVQKKSHQYYWLFSSASLGDLTGDGKVDLVIGGRELRLSENIGTETTPKFGERISLKDINENLLKVHEFDAEELKFYEDRAVLGYIPPPSGDEELSPYVVDWDNDSVLDLLVTNTYLHRGLNVVDFFKGVRTANGHRFQPAVPLFIAKNDGKAFPGMGPRIFVTDWNSDGVKDLLVGTAVIMSNGKFNDHLSWQWQADNNIPGAGKVSSLAKILPTMTEDQRKMQREQIKPPEGMSIDEYLSMYHEGYVFVMLGQGAYPKKEVKPETKRKAGKDKKKK